VPETLGLVPVPIDVGSVSLELYGAGVSAEHIKEQSISLLLSGAAEKADGAAETNAACRSPELVDQWAERLDDPEKSATEPRA
jgi:hypothetical protein